MPPKEPYKVHSLSQHLEDTNKGLSAEAQFSRRPVKKPIAVKNKVESTNMAIFGNDSDDDADSSDDSSDSENEGGGSNFIDKINKKPKATVGSVTSKRSSTNDEIADSDAERNSTVNKTAPAKPVESESESSGDSDSESDSDDAKPEAARDAAGAANTKSSTSSDSSSESDSDEEEGKEEAGKAATANASASENESDSESSSSEDEGNAPPPKPQVTSKPVNGQVASSSDEESANEDEESEDEDEQAAASLDGQSDHEMADESIHMEDRQRDKQIAIPTSIAPDFTLRKGGSGNSGADVARICSQANLEGKQFWYFTVPSGVPISVIQNLEIPMDPAQRSDRVFTHGGEDYGVSFDNMAPKSSIQIMIPSADGSQYQTAPRPVDQVMQVRRITQLGAESALVGPSERNAPRPQPKGLKARFAPIGVNGALGKIGMDSGSEDGDREMTDAPPLPAASNKTRSGKPETTTPKPKKSKRKDVTPQAQEATVPRSGKRKQPSSEDDALAASSQLMDEVTAAEKSTKKPKTVRHASPDLGSEVPPSATTTKQTPVAPPALPNLSFSTPAEVSTPLAKKSKSKKSKDETPVPASSQTLPGKTNTPVSRPRQTAVPIPPIPSSAQQPKVSPIPIPQPVAASQDKPDRKKKRKESLSKPAAANGSPAPSSSAQAPIKKKKKETPVQAPEPKAPA